MAEKRPNVFPTGSQEPQLSQKPQIRTDKLADVPVHNVSIDSDYESSLKLSFKPFFFFMMSCLSFCFFSFDLLTT